MQSTRLLRCLLRASAVLVVGSAGFCWAGQVMQDRGLLPDGHRVRVPAERTSPATPAAARQAQTGPASTPATAPATVPGEKDAAATAPAVPARPVLPPSLLDKPALPAKVVLSGGRLTVEADNSSLSQILGALRTSTGMTVDGLGRDQRVFGQYGPGTPRDVLSSLLDGAGYNFMMVGTTDGGTPQEILLTQRSNAPLVAGEPSTADADDDEQPVVNNYPPEPIPPRPRPSSILPPPAAPDANGRVRTPQEILQELERMRAQQPQQQPQ